MGRIGFKAAELAKLREELAKAHEELAEAIDAYNTAVAAAGTELQVVVDDYNAKLAEVGSFLEAAAVRVDEEEEDRSDAWAESPAAQIVFEWRDELRAIDCCDFEPDLPTPIEHPDSIDEDLGSLEPKP